jgi:hypothetical protein
MPDLVLKISTDLKSLRAMKHSGIIIIESKKGKRVPNFSANINVLFDDVNAYYCYFLL